VSFARGGTAVLCGDGLKWVSLSVVLELLFPLRGAWKKKEE